MEGKIRELLHSGLTVNIELALMLIRSQCKDFDLSSYETLWSNYDYHLPRSTLQEGLQWFLTLDELDFGYLGLEELPGFICELGHVQELILENNELKALPENIGNMTNLIKLDISYTMITQLPESISNLKNMVILQLMHTDISKSERQRIQKRVPWCKLYV